MKSLLLIALTVSLICGDSVETKLPTKIESLIQTSEISISKAFSAYKASSNKELDKLCVSLEKEMKELGKKGDIDTAALIKKKIDEIKSGNFLQNYQNKLQESSNNDDDLLGNISQSIIGKWGINEKLIWEFKKDNTGIHYWGGKEYNLKWKSEKNNFIIFIDGISQPRQLKFIDNKNIDILPGKFSRIEN